MATYFVGDIQGCHKELVALLEQVNFNPKKDELWLTGDLVARGPDSLETLLMLVKMGDCIKTVLGNHDLHLLAVYHGLKKAKPADKLDALLAHKKLDKLMAWLSKQPLLRKLPDEETYLTHAGIPPQWSAKKAVKYAKLAEEKLQSTDKVYWLSVMYGNLPNCWHDAKSEEEKFRFTINALTRMRFVYNDGKLDFEHKLAKATDEKKLHPWFEQTKIKSKTSWIFGHWAALLGQCSASNIYALDTGCVWGNHMTMLHWEKRLFYTKTAILP